MYNRPMVIVALNCIIGVIGGLYFSKNIIPILLVAVAEYFIIILYNRKNKKSHSQSKIVPALLVLVTIFFYGLTSYKEAKFNTLYGNIVGSDIEYTGMVVSVEKETQYYYNYIIRIQNINNCKKYKNTNIMLKVKKTGENNIQYGTVIKGNGIAELPEIRRNYKGFNYLEYLKTKDVYIICTANYKNIDVLECPRVYGVVDTVELFRNMVEEKLIKALPKDCAGISIALLLGNTNYIEDDTRDTYNEANMSHILAISGMHIGYVIELFIVLLSPLGKRKGKYILIIILILFSIFTGRSVSVLRAIIMGILEVSSKLVFRKSDTINNLAISCVIVLLMNPYNLLDLGFQLSFMGIMGIVILNNKITRFERIVFIEKRIKLKMFINVGSICLGKLPVGKYFKILYTKCKEIIIESISANIFIIPILAYNFNTVSLSFLLSSVIIAPILPLSILAGYIAIASLIIFNESLSFICAFLIFFTRALNYIAKCISEVNFLNFTVVTPTIYEILIYYIAILFLLKFKRKLQKEVVASIIILVVTSNFLMNMYLLNKNGLTIHFIDVGQGDSTLVVTNSNKTILIDGGGSESYDVGEKVLIPYLLDRRIKEIDYVMFSHFDLDHAGGCLEVMEQLCVKNIVITKQYKESELYIDAINIAKRKNINVMYVDFADRIAIGDVTIDVFNPQKHLLTDNPMNSNSMVFKLKYKNFSALFTGDIEEESEEVLLKKNINLDADVLKVSHHGSKTSSTEKFIKSVSPKIALIGVGKKNRYGHPSEEVVKRLQFYGARVYRTDINGEITVAVNKEGAIIGVEKCINIFK